MGSPPSLPYYDLTGPFKGSEGFSKILAFSAWEMVPPRMLATMISYESERKNVQTLARRDKNEEREARYFTSESRRRYPAARLNFALVQGGEPQALNLFTLLYPAKCLGSLFDPRDVLNRGLSLRELEREIGRKIEKLLENLKGYEGPGLDGGWYYLAPPCFWMAETMLWIG